MTYTYNIQLLKNNNSNSGIFLSLKEYATIWINLKGFGLGKKKKKLKLSLSLSLSHTYPPWGPCCCRPTPPIHASKPCRRQTIRSMPPNLCFSHLASLFLFFSLLLIWFLSRTTCNIDLVLFFFFFLFCLFLFSVSVLTSCVYFW